MIQRNDAAACLRFKGGMWPYHPDLLATPVPRYTSFPTAAEFAAIESDAYRTALESVEGDVSLYVHIPFCEAICFYCGCNTGAVGRRSRVESYLAALQTEIETVSALLPEGTRIARVAFGGGSPNAIAPADFARLVDTLALRFGLADPVMSIELDPRSMTRRWADTIQEVGIERASLGVQTFAPHCQATIGRIQSEELIRQGTEWLRAAGVTSLNFDLMYGLPRQTREDLLDSLRRTQALGADRIALFGYAHVPHFVPRQRVIDISDMPDQAERFEMAQLGFTHLCTHGYEPVGFDHFAQAGDPLAAAALAGTLHRNFQGFTDDDAPNVIGLGASAISAFPQLLAQNEKNSGRYRMMATQGQLAAARGIARSGEDQRRGRIIESLLCSGGADVSRALLSEVCDSLAPFLERKLASLDGVRLAIAPEGLPYARTIAALFDPYRRESNRRFSSAV